MTNETLEQQAERMAHMVASGDRNGKFVGSTAFIFRELQRVRANALEEAAQAVIELGGTEPSKFTEDESRIFGFALSSAHDTIRALKLSAALLPFTDKENT